MNLASLVRASSLSATSTSRILHRSIAIRPFSCCSISNIPISINPKTPIFLRPPTFSATLSDLQKWQNWAKTLASSVGSSFTDSDNGPDSHNLHRELNWLIEDALENPQSLLTSNEYEIDSVLNLRADLGDLYSLWKQRIEQRRPFQYVVGCEHWRDLVLSVEEGVLIPRPETELIVDLVDDVIKENEELKEGLWVDLGTGSGAIAIGIMRILGDFGRVIAIDLSSVAAQVASFNVKRYNLQGRTVTMVLASIDKISVKQGSWFEPLSEFEGQVAGLVSNPPYIPSGHISGLQAETNGEDQCRFLVDHMETVYDGSFYNLKIVPDFAGIDRFVTGIRS
ncbi:DNA methylase, N-6 adenine-specific, conserved site-containing protein [Cynara cardunculus var. scolymus]|uniref:DNA methylase, N-6 adenine-specific, conserved site-containing protein n=1 Tax=Cynara cardunculus var. scolymus TaxID=59895 RepID=A0A103YJN0_CYNCS|nr:DNA methylase, N-6 adenine-specific, conserved site-containing protein [Cynara cardunculus var. scolymus]